MPHFYVLHTHFRHLLQKPVYVKRNQYHEFQPLKFNWFIEGKNVIFSKVWPDVPTHQWWQVSNHDWGELITFYIFRALFSSTIYYQNLMSSTVFYFKKSKNDTRECSLSFDHLKKKWSIRLYYQLTAAAVRSEYIYSKTWWKIIFKDLSFLSRCDSTLVALRGSVIVHIVSDKSS